ncbi:MAG: glucose-6-phosphate isomerase [bacterium]|nr:glucose-6-phosphate isomerase [bacterium]MDE0440106.1 glucose-6-phosphate isomerase [bacterium]
MLEFPTISFALGSLTERVDARLAAWDGEDFGARMWARDHTLWSREPIPELTNRLGWLWLPGETGQVAGIEQFAAEVRHEADRVVLLGMGGSSLAPEVYQATFGNDDGYPELQVLDSTHPEAVRGAEAMLDPVRTLFVVASKSGGTIETLSLFRYFWRWMSDAVGQPGERFVAFTDPGSGLEALGRERGFRRIFPTPPDVGGRYSALTPFGLVPAALIGMDVRRLLRSAAAMAEACGAPVPPSANPGLRLAAAMGEAALAGRDKLTYVCSPALEAFGGWVEQLIAESTGKQGKGVVPVVGEPLGDPGVYSDDRVFASMTLDGEDSSGQDAALALLEAAGHPVIRIVLHDLYDLGAEMFRSEMAVAAAGSILGINPFDQPDVQVAKDLTKRAMSAEGLDVAIDEVSTGRPDELADRLGEWIGTLRAGGYIAIHAYLPMDGPATPVLEQLVATLRDRYRAAATLGFGPRFLHSTGQLHKGGAGNGLFLQFVDTPARDLEVPEAGFDFGKLIEGQAAGDYQALAGRRRRVLRVRLGEDPEAGVAMVRDIVTAVA